MIQLPGVTITPDARSALSKAASMFILYTTSHANRVAGLDNRTNLTPQDVVEAAHYMDFDAFAPELKRVYQKNKKKREEANEKRRQRRRKTNSLLHDAGDGASAASSQQQVDDGEEEDDDDEESGDEDEGQVSHDKSRSLNGSEVPIVTIDDSSNE